MRENRRPIDKVLRWRYNKVTNRTEDTIKAMATIAEFLGDVQRQRGISLRHLGRESGVPVEEGDLLGTLFDPYTFEETETLRAPIDGILYIARRSGPVRAGGHAYSVADYAVSHWID